VARQTLNAPIVLLPNMLFHKFIIQEIIGILFQSITGETYSGGVVGDGLTTDGGVVGGGLTTDGGVVGGGLTTDGGVVGGRLTTGNFGANKFLKKFATLFAMFLSQLKLAIPLGSTNITGFPLQ